MCGPYLASSQGFTVCIQCRSYTPCTVLPFYGFSLASFPSLSFKFMLCIFVSHVNFFLNQGGTNKLIFPFMYKLLTLLKKTRGKGRQSNRLWQCMADFKRPQGYPVKRRYYFYPTLYSFSFMYSTRQLHNANPFYCYIHYFNATKYLKIKNKGM